jgi:hypothetical protein
MRSYREAHCSSSFVKTAPKRLSHKDRRASADLFAAFLFAALGFEATSAARARRTMAELAAGKTKTCSAFAKSG